MLALIGAAVGIAAALGVMRYFDVMLYGVRPNDPLTIIAVAVLLAWLSRSPPVTSPRAAPCASTLWSRCATNKLSSRYVLTPHSLLT